MTAAGQAMVVLVPIRQAPAFKTVDDIDAEHMGLKEDEEKRFDEPAEEAKRRRELRKTEVNDFRTERKEARKVRAAERKARGKTDLLLKEPKAAKRALPSFLKVKGKEESPSKVARASPDASSEEDEEDEEAGPASPSPQGGASGSASGAAGAKTAAAAAASSAAAAGAETAAAKEDKEEESGLGGLGLGGYDSDDDDDDDDEEDDE
eukprot:CAMPEP_0206628916 /NCGR_PEP_ID=MMETSP0325_2-20121206/66771_1 /ASSEMBLY_ACC=CAM_ASM_000347 /TAXON_ID=2866 /ORGANISM="Crypthecodinium cohnii, Strain Seligo" /LENGTH=206 /DNA_ID=CAMNT_0054153693 /DNA_START=59 /DNA_END=679 /DNA_ORIENTATION=-